MVLKRRNWFVAVAGLAWYIQSYRGSSAGDVVLMKKFTMDLCPGKIGVKANQREAILLASRHGFQSVEPEISYLTSLGQSQLDEIVGLLKEKHLVWGAAPVTVNFRGENGDFESGLKLLPDIAKGLQRAGVKRVGTWISPSHHELTYLANFRAHQERLSKIAKIYHEHGIRLGLEYVGPKTSWTSKKFSFIHTMAEAKELIHAIDSPNVGLVLDSWHWYCADETVEDLLTLTNEQIVAVDLNDAPSGIPREEQIDNRRELPSATGVIDVNAFLDALRRIGYDGPVRAEPFNQQLNAMDDEEAVKATSAAMKKAISS